jgi:sterol desaturase/sphingolipid hydroxylase (fatty acid hydroxylase superfamily)
MSNPEYLRFGSFAVMFSIMASWEIMAARRPLVASKALRWSGNLGVLAIDTALVRLIFTVLPVEMAQRVQGTGWGILNTGSPPYWLKVIIGLMLLDLAIYLQHLMFHAVPIFWRLHMMHHADLDLDFTTGVRFHPLEIVLSMQLSWLPRPLWLSFFSSFYSTPRPCSTMETSAFPGPLTGSSVSL